jgi:hypothetical protein
VMASPPDLVKTVAAIRRHLRRIPDHHPRRAHLLDHMTVLAGIHQRIVMGRALPPVTTPEDTLREAGIADARQASYQRQFSALLAGGRPRDEKSDDGRMTTPLTAADSALLVETIHSEVMALLLAFLREHRVRQFGGQFTLNAAPEASGGFVTSCDIRTHHRGAKREKT